MKILATLFSFAFCLTAFGADISLSWNPSVSTNANAYRVYAWTNLPSVSCAVSNAVEVVQVGSATNVTVTDIVPASYTFAATAVDTNTGAESQFSNFALWVVPEAPKVLTITPQVSTNLLDWQDITNVMGSKILFRLRIN
ncbi:MAG: hypothetical protein KGL39_52375 [Patescibacteria group bacterium]|nr:hypothetical protein [Patescibacteria group bacterium]